MIAKDIPDLFGTRRVSKTLVVMDFENVWKQAEYLMKKYGWGWCCFNSSALNEKLIENHPPHVCARFHAFNLMRRHAKGNLMQGLEIRGWRGVPIDSSKFSTVDEAIIADLQSCPKSVKHVVLVSGDGGYTSDLFALRDRGRQVFVASINPPALNKCYPRCGFPVVELDPFSLLDYSHKGKEVDWRLGESQCSYQRRRKDWLEQERQKLAREWEERFTV